MAQAETSPAVDVEQSFSLPVGFASPLWLAFAGAAATGAAFFWTSRWARPINLEAKLAGITPAAPLDLAAVDDLTRLVGIGPKLAAALSQRGVTRFAQIAAWTDDDLVEVDQALSLKGRAVRNAWVTQARRLIETTA